MARSGRGRAVAIAVAVVASGFVTTASAQQPFYQGKQITMVVGSAPSGGYDLYARLLARHWPQVIPGNPNFVVQNMDGAGSLSPPTSWPIPRRATAPRSAVCRTTWASSRCSA